MRSSTLNRHIIRFSGVFSVLADCRYYFHYNEDEHCFYLFATGLPARNSFQWLKTPNNESDRESAKRILLFQSLNGSFAA